jgi:transposase
MLRRVKEDGWSITQAAAAYGFSRSSFYELQTEFDHAGLMGLMPERRGPREAHKLSGPVMTFIEELKQKDQSIRTADVIRLIKEKFGIEVHRRSIERALTRAKKKLQ